MCAGCPKKRHKIVLDPDAFFARCKVCKRPLLLDGTGWYHDPSQAAK